MSSAGLAACRKGRGLTLWRASFFSRTADSLRRSALFFNGLFEADRRIVICRKGNFTVEATALQKRSKVISEKGE